VLALHFLQVSLQAIPDRRGQHRPHVLLALAPAHDNLMPVEVDILDA